MAGVGIEPLVDVRQLWRLSSLNEAVSRAEMKCARLYIHDMKPRSFARVGEPCEVPRIGVAGGATA